MPWAASSSKANKTGCIPAIYQVELRIIWLYLCFIISTVFREQPSNEHLSTEMESLQNTVSPQAVNSSSCTLASTLTTSAPPVTTLALPCSRGQNCLLTEAIRAEEASEAFREHRATLLVAVMDPLILANILYAKRIISKGILDQIRFKAHTPAEKNMTIFDAIEARIRTNPPDFNVVLDILSGDPQLCMFAGLLHQSYGECISLVPRSHPQGRKRVWGHWSIFLVLHIITWGQYNSMPVLSV